MNNFFKIFAVILLASASSYGQAIILKDGTRIPADDFRVEDGKIIRTMRIQGDKTATTSVTEAQMGALDWPEPTQLIDARSLMAQGKTADAVAILKDGVDFFAPFQKVKGGDVRYTEVFFTYVDALNQSRQFEETVKQMRQLDGLPLNEAQKLKLKVIKLDIERQTSSDYGSIIAQADNILGSTDDSGISAAVWSIKAEIFAKKKEWETAMMAYLRIPVLFGTQMDRVPDAELNAARMLVKMKRYEDATKFFTRLVEQYPGSAVAEAAGKEKAAINGMKNQDQEVTPAEDSKDKPAQS
ncbi:MAG: tetratricopeptide repeat protein [Verrucomicrobiales bacterium]|nr:tetratricopeptide repeat protein [Verrucomicrobiales bacterium]MCP5558589.1 tetratricopeptide repeat protein [Verrucomicrobiaceae bacterium]